MDKYIVKLTEAEREFLETLRKTGKSSAKKILYANILLEADENNFKQSDKEISIKLNISSKTVKRIRKTMVIEGFEAALARKKHSKTKLRKITGEEEAQMIRICCSKAPEGRVRWTLNLVRDELIQLGTFSNISRSTVQRAMATNELKPWLNKEWCIPPEQNGEFVCNMEDVLDVYKRPYNEKYPVVCMDELNKQLTKETEVPIVMKAGKPFRFDTHYERNGTCNVFMACEPLQGKRCTRVTDQRTKLDWANFIKEIVDVQYPDAEKIVLVCDNLNTHTGGALYEAFEPKEARRILKKLEIHYTPKHGSWLNMAEIELSHLSRQCLDRRIGEKEILISEISAWEKMRNEEKTIINWQFTTEDARIKLKRLYPVQFVEGQN
jgi:DNA-binding Lrp family transcriptional regulator